MPEKLSTAGTLIACVTGALVIGGASALVMTSKVADAQIGGIGWPRVVSCEGGRALCGDRSDDAMPDVGAFATRDTDAAGCGGGRASCGDRRDERHLARVSPFTSSPLDAGDHPRTLTR